MPKTLSPKQIDARKYSRLTDSKSEERELLRQRLGAEVAAWEAAGNKVTEVPIGASGYTMNGGTTMAKYRENGLKKLNVAKKEVPEDE